MAVKAGVRFVNDSTRTNVRATLAALAGLASCQNISLIAVRESNGEAYPPLTMETSRM